MSSSKEAEILTRKWGQAEKCQKPLPVIFWWDNYYRSYIPHFFQCGNYYSSYSLPQQHQHLWNKRSNRSACRRQLTFKGQLTMVVVCGMPELWRQSLEDQCKFKFILNLIVCSRPTKIIECYIKNKYKYVIK